MVKLYHSTRPAHYEIHIISVIDTSNLRMADGKINYCRSKNFSFLRGYGGGREEQ
jgi:hypothetical protein